MYVLSTHFNLCRLCKERTAAGIGVCNSNVETRKSPSPNQTVCFSVNTETQAAPQGAVPPLTDKQPMMLQSTRGLKTTSSGDCQPQGNTMK